MHGSKLYCNCEVTLSKPLDCCTLQTDLFTSCFSVTNRLFRISVLTSVCLYFVLEDFYGETVHKYDCCYGIKEYTILQCLTLYYAYVYNTLILGIG